ncbi:MAG: tRNA 2-thiouridine(34) synthase MnmA, partial [Phycisphaerae bacterium]
IGGRTPNPCVRCNDQLKFGRLLEYADTVGAKYIATGHYARVGYRVGASVAVAECGEVPAATSGRHCRVLMRAYDKQKDQSYVLFGLNRGVLDRVMFPIGGYSKSDVRALAAGFGLPNHDKPDSVEICFVPDGDYARMLRQRRPEAFSTGDVVASTGRVIGQHKGVGCYTIGQRRGLGIAAGTPMYVTHLDALHNTVTVGGADELLSCTLMADGVNYLVDPPDSPFRAQVKIRYMHEAAEATVHRLDGGGWRVIFDQAQRAITPGQAVVCYDGDVVIGGGWIDRADAP